MIQNFKRTRILAKALFPVCVALSSLTALAVTYMPSTGIENGVSTEHLFSNHDRGPQTTAIVLVNFEDDSSQPISTDYASALGQRLNRFIHTESYGLASVVPTVFGWWTLPALKNNPNFSNCELGGASFVPLHQEVLKAATSHGVNLRNFERLVVYYQYGPKQCGRGGAGNTTIGTFDGFYGVSQIDAQYANHWGYGYSIGALQHEFGHGLGFNHPSAWSCGSESISANCMVGEGNTKLADRWDNMTSWEEYNAVEKYAAGWIAPNEVVQVTQSGTYTLDPEELSAAKTKLLAVEGIDPRTLRKMTYYIELRQPLKADGDQPVVNPSPAPEAPRGIWEIIRDIFKNVVNPISTPSSNGPTDLTAQDIINAPLPIYGSIANLGNASKGVLIRTARQELDEHSAPISLTTDLINASASQYPSNESDLNSNLNSALTEGSTFTDPTTHTRITLVSLQQGVAATIRVDIGQIAAGVAVNQIEAEDPSNEISGGASVRACAECSGGQAVGGIGGKGYLRFDQIGVDTSKSYRIIVNYLNPDAGVRSEFYSVNQGPAVAIAFPSTRGLGKTARLTLQADLQAGKNSLVFYGSTPLGDIDRISISQ